MDHAFGVDYKHSRCGCGCGRIQPARPKKVEKRPISDHERCCNEKYYKCLK